MDKAPRPGGNRSPISNDLSLRTERVYARMGNRRRTMDALGIGESTLDAVLEGGTLMPKTIAKVRDALDRFEARAC